MNGPQPGFHALRPSRNRERGPAQAVAVSALSVDVHFGRDFGVLESEEVDGGVFDVHRVVLCLDDERGRRFAGNHNIGVGREVLVCEGEVARIDDHGEVRAATELVSGIDRIVETLIEVSAEGGGKVGSGREAEDADPVRVDSPVGGMEADDTESPLGILEGSRRLGIGPGIGHAVFEQGACDAGGVEPVAYLGAFEVDGQDPVSHLLERRPRRRRCSRPWACRE